MRVAAFQLPPVLDDARAATAAIAAGVSWAADQGADLAVFPEAYLHGHTYDRETIAKRARSLDDPEVTELAEARPNERGVDAGEDMPVFDAGGFRFAVNICKARRAGSCWT